MSPAMSSRYIHNKSKSLNLPCRLFRSSSKRPTDIRYHSLGAYPAGVFVNKPIRRLSIQLGALMLVAAIAACSGGTGQYDARLNPGTVECAKRYDELDGPDHRAGDGCRGNLDRRCSAIDEQCRDNHGNGEYRELCGPRVSVSIARSAEATRTAQASTPTGIVYLEFAPAANTTLNGSPGLTFTLPSITAGVSYYLGTYGAKWLDLAVGRTRNRERFDRCLYGGHG